MTNDDATIGGINLERKDTKDVIMEKIIERLILIKDEEKLKVIYCFTMAITKKQK